MIHNREELAREMRAERVALLAEFELLTGAEQSVMNQMMSRTSNRMLRRVLDRVRAELDGEDVDNLFAHGAASLRENADAVLPLNNDDELHPAVLVDAVVHSCTSGYTCVPNGMRVTFNDRAAGEPFHLSEREQCWRAQLIGALDQTPGTLVGSYWISEDMFGWVVTGRCDLPVNPVHYPERW
ncbi:MAG: hypothetical protein V9F04_04515 [Dermatophilaceae bacterium]